MGIYITIDGGTTHTRINLVKDKKLISGVKLSIGARANMGDKNLLKTEIKKGIEKLLQENNIEAKAVVRILASGMITSEFGLCHLEHILTPAGMDALHNSMFETTIKEVSDIPFVFIRGVKMASDSFEKMDVMRGEETELMGLMEPAWGKCVYILPGSHSKIIKTDAEGRIFDFSTMQTGEMIEALSQHTILKDAVDLTVSDIDEEFLLKGFDFCRQEGINKALFKIRILKNFFACKKEEIYSFFMGVILAGEMEQIIKCDAGAVALGGKMQIKNAMEIILQNRSDKKVIPIGEEAVQLSTAIGAVKIFEGNK